MQANRGRDTKPELALRGELHRLGLRYRVDAPVVPGIRRRADVAFASARVAVFVHGCYWHGCADHGTRAKANSEYWSHKIAENQRRDRDTEDRLRSAGWEPVIVWEHEVARDAALSIKQVVDRRRAELKKPAN
ncbi:MAG: very short patch repair endonuclease [Frankiaceae bacterium]|nr:very short patch repair endonuclease [Frankiaceae bacterium]MBV9871283.1 very short patch repair endonuclease [Frankiaceae bacterium]